MRYMDPRAGSAREILGVENFQIGCLVDLVDDQSDQPAFILAGGGMSGCKDELTWITARSEIVHVPDTGL